MNRNRWLRNLGLVFMGLLLVWAVRTFWPQSDPDQQQYLKQWGLIELNQIDKVVIEKDGQKMEMKKEGEIWSLDGKTIKTERVNEVVKALIQPKEVTVVSLSGLKNEELGLSSRSAIISIMADENNQWQIKMGKVNMNGRYLSLAGSETVYSVSEVPSMVDSTNINDWIEPEPTPTEAVNQ